MFLTGGAGSHPHTHCDLIAVILLGGAHLEGDLFAPTITCSGGGSRSLVICPQHYHIIPYHSSRDFGNSQYLLYALVLQRLYLIGGPFYAGASFSVSADSVLSY